MNPFILAEIPLHDELIFHILRGPAQAVRFFFATTAQAVVRFGKRLGLTGGHLKSFSVITAAFLILHPRGRKILGQFFRFMLAAARSDRSRSITGISSNAIPSGPVPEVSGEPIVRKSVRRLISLAMINSVKLKLNICLVQSRYPNDLKIVERTAKTKLKRTAKMYPKMTVGFSGKYNISSTSNASRLTLYLHHFL